jgi:DNA modification methylase
MINELIKAIKENNRWYKNCKNVRKRGGKICQVCPFKDIIRQEEFEILDRKKHPNRIEYIRSGHCDLTG